MGNNRIYNTLEEFVGIGKEVSKLGGHIILGLLPEQEKLEEKISWYNAEDGVRLSRGVEALAGVPGPIYLNDPAPIMLLNNLFLSITMRYSSLEKTDDKSHTNIFGTNERLGNIVLEAGYRSIKRLISSNEGVQKQRTPTD